MNKINVCNEEGEIVARVENNSNLDFWDGSNWTCGSVGHHLGITRLKNGAFVLIHGSQWQGDRDWGEIVSDVEAIQAILRGDSADAMLEKWGLSATGAGIMEEEEEKEKGKEGTEG